MCELILGIEEEEGGGALVSAGRRAKKNSEMLVDEWDGWAEALGVRLGDAKERAVDGR